MIIRDLAASGSIGYMPKISKQRLLTLGVPIAPFDKQNGFAGWVEHARAIQMQQFAATVKVRETFGALLASVFSERRP